MIILVAAFSLIALQSNAQWLANGIDIHNTNAGNVGIGINAPLVDLHVYDDEGDCKLTLESPHTGADRVIGKYEILNSATGDKLTTLLRLKSGNHEMVNVGYNASTSTYIPFQYINYTTRKFEMRTGILDAEFKNSGNILFTNTGGVMIDTTYLPAGYSLAVNGKVIVESLEVQLGSGWPDYVFSDDYQLRSLYELEMFINTNNHLPEVPSAQEIENGTLNVGEMNATLLKKVEELTLYIIQLQKEVDILKESRKLK